MGATLTTASNVLKEIYEPKLQTQLVNNTKTAKRLEQTSEGVGSTIGGKYVKFAIHVKRNHGIGSRQEMEALPVAQNQGYTTAQVNLTYQYGSVRLSGQSLELANNDYQTFASVMTEELDGVREDLATDYNRQVYGTAVGVLMTASATYTTVNTIPTTNTQYMEVGMFVDIFQADGTTLIAAGRNVTAVNKNASIVIDGAAISGVATNIVVRAGNVNREIIGLAQIVSATGTLYGVDPAVESSWKSVVDANGGTNRALSESMMITEIDNIKATGGDTTLITTTNGVRRAYFNLLQQQRKFTNTTEFTGGFKGLAFTTEDGDIPLITDLFCQPNTMYFLNEKKLKIYRANDWEFMDRDGSKWNRVPGYDAYDATLYKYHQLGTHRRNTHGVVKDITEA